MPYKDKERQRRYNLDWAKRNPQAAASTPLTRRIEAVIAEAERPLSPAAILVALNSPTVTRSSLKVAIHRLMAAGRIRSVGRAQWVKA